MVDMNIEQIKQMLEGAPEGATHCFHYGDYFKHTAEGALVWNGKSAWFMSELTDGELTHNLNDLRTILAQHEEIERLKNPWIKFADAHPTVAGEYLLSKPTKWTTYNVFGFDGENFDAPVEFIGEWLLLPPKEQNDE